MTDLKHKAIQVFKFKELELGDKITVINPPETFVHYHPRDAIVYREAILYLEKKAKEQKRAIARPFGPRPEWMRGE